VSIFVNIGCHRIYPPERPDGVPAEAVWAGGTDGGGWVYCSSPSLEFNECTIYDEEGHSPGPARYVLQQSGGAATPEQLKYTYLTGKAIGLEGGLELVKINDTN
jgi:hypothetical protein